MLFRSNLILCLSPCREWCNDGQDRLYWRLEESHEARQASSFAKDLAGCRDSAVEMTVGRLLGVPARVL